MVDSLTVTRLAQTIATAPAWALVSLTMPDADLRERGAEELARWIANHDAMEQRDTRQLGLPL